MEIQERTVNYHLKQACRKLGAANRLQAVARAVQSREVAISLDKTTVIDHQGG
ncbi:Bacterial regulatory protein, luxR family [compost metagenome]